MTQPIMTPSKRIALRIRNISARSLAMLLMQSNMAMAVGVPNLALNSDLQIIHNITNASDNTSYNIDSQTDPTFSSTSNIDQIKAAAVAEYGVLRVRSSWKTPSSTKSLLRLMILSTSHRCIY